MWILIRFQINQMPPAGSSEALLSGQKPPFRLLVRAVNTDGTPATHIRFLVSDAFVVGFSLRPPNSLLVTFSCQSPCYPPASFLELSWKADVTWLGRNFIR